MKLYVWLSSAVPSQVRLQASQSVIKIIFLVVGKDFPGCLPFFFGLELSPPRSVSCVLFSFLALNDYSPIFCYAKLRPICYNASITICCGIADG